MFYSSGAEVEFAWIMIGIVAACAAGFLTSIFPIFGTVMILLLVAIGLAVIIGVVRHVLRERRLDWEAFYGPLDIEETKEN
jgi:hypothetical protein